MEHLKLFPTTVGGFKDNVTTERLLPIARKILEDPSNNTNTWNYKTTYSKDCSNISELSFFRDYVKSVGSNYLDSLGYKSLDLTPEIFFSEMIPGDFHAAHEHPDAVLSGVAYLTVPEGSAPIRFYDPRPHVKFLSIPVVESKESNWLWYNVQPEEGLILIWPAWLTHEVLVNNSTSGRITAVFNLSL